MRIEINPTYRHLEPFIQQIPELFDSSGEILYEGRNTLRMYNINGLQIVIKRFKQPHLINRFVYGTIRESKAERSYMHAFELIKHNINTPGPIAFIEHYNFGLRDSYYVSLCSTMQHELREFCNDAPVNGSALLFEELGFFSARLHNLGILHRDFSPGNILFDIIHGKPVFSLVDINRISFKQISEEAGYQAMKRLWLSDEAYQLVARAYAKGRKLNEEKAVKRILQLKNHFMENRYK